MSMALSNNYHANGIPINGMQKVPPGGTNFGKKIIKANNNNNSSFSHFSFFIFPLMVTIEKLENRMISKCIIIPLLDTNRA